MATPLTDRELEQLNAYIDGELSPEDTLRLEQRLLDDEALQAELESLQATANLLGLLEPVRVPRNFTLDPEIYGKPQASDRGFWGWLARPALTAAGAIAAIVLVFGFVFVLGRDGGDLGSSVADQPQAEMEEEPAEEEEMAEEEEAELVEPDALPESVDDEAIGAPGESDPAAGALTQENAAEQDAVEEEMAEEDFLDEETEAEEAASEDEAEAPPAPEVVEVTPLEGEGADAEEAGEMTFEESQGDFSTPLPSYGDEDGAFPEDNAGLSELAEPTVMPLPTQTTTSERSTDQIVQPTTAAESPEEQSSDGSSQSADSFTSAEDFTDGVERTLIRVSIAAVVVIFVIIGFFVVRRRNKNR